MRFEIFRADRYGEGAGPLDFRRHQAVGPADAPRTVELFHTTSYARQSVTENGETTTRWVPTGDQRYAGSTAVEPVTDTPPESAPTPTRAAQDPRLAPVPEPAAARTWSDLRELADEVIARGPVAISALGPCAGLVRRLTDRLFPGGGVRPGAALDDLTTSRSATEYALAPGPRLGVGALLGRGRRRAARLRTGHPRRRPRRQPGRPARPRLGGLPAPGHRRTRRGLGEPDARP